VICRICDQDLTIPKDAVLIDEARGLLTYRFKNGEVHMFKRQHKVPKTEEKGNDDSR
jgi:hypothetical protein